MNLERGMNMGFQISGSGGGEEKPCLLEPFQQRVVQERFELDERRGKLNAFMGSRAYFMGVDAAERARLQRQAWLMADLSGVLGERIAAFKVPGPLRSMELEIGDQWTAQQLRDMAGAEKAELNLIRPPRLTTDPAHPGLVHANDDTPRNQADTYLVLSAEERAKGFTRPLRTAYIHKTCGALTVIGSAIAETYARDPGFYTGTYCVVCRMHKPLSEFRWDGGGPDGEGPVVGS